MVDPAGTRTRSRFDLESWSTPRALQNRPEYPGAAGPRCGPSEPGTGHVGQLVDPAAPRTWAGVPRDHWLNPRASEQSASHPGQLEVPTGSRAVARVVRYIWSTLWVLGHWTESPRTAGRPRGHSDTGPRASHTGQMIDPVGPRIRARVARDSWLTPRAHRHRPNSPGTADRTHGHSDPGPSTRGSWSNPRALRHGLQSSSTAGRHPGNLDTCASRPGELVNTTGTKTRARIKPESWATTWAHVHGPESPRRAA